MGFIHESHGRSRIAVEERSESFYILPAYGHDITCPTCNGYPLMGGRCRECDGSGEIPHPFKGEIEREFLLEDVPDLLRALADLSTCPEHIRQAIMKAPDRLAATEENR